MSITHTLQQVGGSSGRHNPMLLTCAKLWPALHRRHCHANLSAYHADRQRLNLTESIDYLPPNSKVYRQWLRGQPHRSGHNTAHGECWIILLPSPAVPASTCVTWYGSAGGPGTGGS